VIQHGGEIAPRVTLRAQQVAEGGPVVAEVVPPQRDAAQGEGCSGGPPRAAQCLSPVPGQHRRDGQGVESHQPRYPEGDSAEKTQQSQGARADSGALPFFHDIGRSDQTQIAEHERLSRGSPRLHAGDQQVGGRARRQERAQRAHPLVEGAPAEPAGRRYVDSGEQPGDQLEGDGISSERSEERSDEVRLQGGQIGLPRMEDRALAAQDAQDLQANHALVVVVAPAGADEQAQA